MYALTHTVTNFEILLGGWYVSGYSSFTVLKIRRIGTNTTIADQSLIHKDTKPLWIDMGARHCLSESFDGRCWAFNNKLYASC